MRGDQTAKINVYGFEKEETVDGLTYDFYTNKTAILTNVPMDLMEVVIPPQVGDYKVTAMKDEIFAHHYNCKLIYFPEAITFTDDKSRKQFVRGSESCTVYVLGIAECKLLGVCLGQYTDIAYENLVKFDDCYYIISEQGASLIRYVGSGTSTYYVPNSITVNGKSVNVFEVARKAFDIRANPSDKICEYVFNP